MDVRAGSTSTEARQPAVSPTLGAALLSAAALAAGILILLWSRHLPATLVSIHVTWWELAPAFLLAQVLAVHLEFRGGAHSLTLSELPLVIGLCFASPAAVLAGRLIGEAAAFGVYRRQPLKKLSFNLSVSFAESAAAIALFRGLSSGHPLVEPHTWLAALLAVSIPGLASSSLVWSVIRWHGGQPRLLPLTMAAVLTGLVNARLALVAAVVLVVKPVGLLLFVPVGAMLAASYRSYTRLSQRYASLQLLYEFTKAVGSSIGTGSVAQEVLSEARKLLQAGWAEVVLIDQGGTDGAVRQRSSGTHLLDLDTPDGASLGAYRSATEHLRRGEALLLSRSSRRPGEQRLRAALGVRDAIVAPIRLENSVSGWLVVADRLGDVRGFDEQDRRLFETLANHASVAFQNERLVEQLRQEASDRRHEALHDALTGLPNRASFMSAVKALLADERRTCSVVLMDLDGFKEINDTLGHDLGDKMLREVARRLCSVVGDPGVVARLGGDEFAVVLDEVPSRAGVPSRAHAEQTAAAIAEAVARPILLDGLALEVAMSAGIACSPEHGLDAETLLRHAEVAMYSAKSAKDGVVVYSPERDSYSPRRLALAGELRSAIDHGDMLVYYQPKARLADGTVVAAEALVRWRHPRHGFLPPDEFISVAEATGLILPLTAHVLGAAVEQCGRWSEEGLHLGVAVNLSVRSLLDADLPALVGNLLERHGVPPNRLTLELTETSVMADPVRSIAALERLAALGVRLSVDDFGAGYSSLGYLQRLPVHEVKIDKAFVMNLSTNAGDAMIVRSIVELGHNLALSVVAEGVQDERAWRMLQAMSCDVAQGYLLSPPVPPEGFVRWLEERARWTARVAARVAS